MIRIALLLCALLLCVPPIDAQGPEWMMRIPKYYRLKGGSSMLVSDPTRKAVLFDGGPYDTYVTYDEGASWELIFDLKMFFIDVASQWKIDTKGNWFYLGKVYAYFNINLVTDDAGKTIRYLNPDTTILPQIGRYEQPVQLADPDAIYIDYTQRTSEADSARRGIYASCDVGKTWQFIKRMSNSDALGMLRNVAPNRLNIVLNSQVYVEHDLCSPRADTTNISTSSTYLRLGDGITLLYSLYASGSSPLRVRRSGVDTEEVYSSYIEPETGTSRDFAPYIVSRLDDTSAIVIATRGVIARYCKNSGLVILDIPPYRNADQKVHAVGRLGDRVLLRTLIPSGMGADSVVRWTLLNTKTGVVNKFIRPGSVFGFGLFWATTTIFENQRIVPITDSVWLASLELGELMRTTDAGQTWRMVENMPRDEQWGLNYVGANRLYPRGEGSMAVLTENGRLMVNEPGTKNWSVSHQGPFAHAIKGPSGTIFHYSGNRNFYGEDYRAVYRSRYGPSTAYFHTPNSLWTSGDVVTRWTANGEFIDTTLARRARVIKRVSDNIVVASMDSVWISGNNGREWVYISEHWPKAIFGKDTVKSALGDMVESKNGDLIAGLRGIRLYDSLGVVIDSIPGGILRSVDSGLTWSPGPTGIPNNVYVSSLLKLPSGTLLCLASDVVLDPRKVDPYQGPYRLALNNCGESEYKMGQAYIYRSVDDGWTWTQTFIFPSREFLPATDPRLVMMPDGRVMAIQPDAGIAISATDGASFGIGDPLYIGNPVIHDAAFTDDGWAHFATDSGYVRVRISNILDVKEETRNIGTLKAHVNAADVLSITCDIMPTSIRLIALDGTTVRSTVEPLTHSLTLDVSALAAGTYVVVAANTNEVRSALIQLP